MMIKTMMMMTTMTTMTMTTKQTKNKKHKEKHKGIEKALESLLEIREDNKGGIKDQALDEVIEKLISMLRESGTVQSDAEATEALAEKLETDIEEGVATTEKVVILVEMKLKNKKINEAANHLENALPTNPDAHDLYELLSEVYTEQGNTENIKVFVEGKMPKFDVEPYIKEGRNLVPVRAISEALGSEVDWDQVT